MRVNVRIASISAAVAIASLLFAGASHAAPPGDLSSKPSAAGDDRRSARLDTASSAMPTAEDPTVSDHATSTVHAGRSESKGVASAVATSDCDGCAGTSTAFQVVYFDAADAAGAADNSAVAWTSCVDCSSSAVSVQLLIVRDPARLAVNNRALAVNVACDACATSATAIQFVLAGGPKRELTNRSRDLISQIEQQLAERLSGSSADSRQRDESTAYGLADETARQLEQVILSDLGGTTVQRSIDVQVAG